MFFFFLGLMLRNSFNRLLIVLLKLFWNRRKVHIKRFRSVFSWFLLFKYCLFFFEPIFFCIFQHVVLVGGFAASDWLFTKVQELLTPTGLNIVRPENHVWVVLAKIKKDITIHTSKKKKPPSFIGTRLFRMARYRFTSTTLWELGFLKWHMAISAI